MSIDFSTLKDLARVSSLSELRLTNSDQLLEKRNGLSAFFKKLDDFFKGFSASGRAEIAARNEAILARMGIAVESAQNAAPASEALQRELPALQRAFDRLKNAVASTSHKAFLDRMEELKQKAEFTALAPAAQEALLHACEVISRKYPFESWRAKMDAVCERFFLPFDAEHVAAGVAQKLLAEFSKPTQWGHVGGVQILPEANQETLNNALKDAVEKLRAHSFEPVDLQHLRSTLLTYCDNILYKATQTGLDETRENLLAHLTAVAAELRTSVGNTVVQLAGQGQGEPSAETLRDFIDAILEEGLNAEKLGKTTERAMHLKGIHESFLLDANRATIRRLGNDIVEREQIKTPEVYTQALRRELGADRERLLPFISMMLSQAGMQGILVDIPSFANIPYMGLIGEGICEQTVSAKLSALRQGNEFIILYEGRQDYVTMDKDRLWQVQTSATMRIDLNDLRQMPLLSRDAYVPGFTIENVTMDFVPATAENGPSIA